MNFNRPSLPLSPTRLPPFCWVRSTRRFAGWRGDQAHEIGWMHEEIDAINAALEREPDLAPSHHLDDVIERYSAASDALGDAIEAAFEAGDRARIADLKALLMQRVANEQEILGQLDLVGRG